MNAINLLLFCYQIARLIFLIYLGAYDYMHYEA